MSQAELDLFSVENRIVVITGGLGQLGRQYSLALASRGAKVAVFDARAEASSLETPTQDSNIVPLQVDVTNRESLEIGLRHIQETWGTPDALVNNAALDSPPDAPSEENGPFESYPEKSWDEVMAVTSKGVFLCCQIIGGAMASAGKGSVINICSIYGLVSPDQRIYEYRKRSGDEFFKPVAYGAAKASLVNLTQYLATYWSHRGVRVNTLTLGGVFNQQDSEFLKGYTQRVPLGRMAREDEYNGALVFLVSDASSYMTGSNLVIDGGWTAW